jgi:hypothetical protein
MSRSPASPAPISLRPREGRLFYSPHQRQPLSPAPRGWPKHGCTGALGRDDQPLGEGFHPIRRRRPERCLHHFVSHPAKEEGIGLVEVLDHVTMQVFGGLNYTMIAASVNVTLMEYRRGRITQEYRR